MSKNEVSRGRKPFAATSIGDFLRARPDAQGLSLEDAYNLYAEYNVTNNGRIVAYNTFKVNFCSRDFKKALKLPAMPANFQAPVAKNPQMSLQAQFYRLQAYISIVADKNISALYIGGDSSIGKSHVVEETLKTLGTKYVLYQGGNKGASELVQLLYMNRNDMVIVFDDFDSIFKNKACRDILKCAMDDTKVKTISWIDNTKRAKKNIVPNQFEFTSSIIVVSNVTKIDKAIRSRMQVSIIQTTKEEALEWIKAHFSTFVEDLPMEFKMEVYEFAKANLGKFKAMNYRIFKNILLDYLIDVKMNNKDGTWKAAALGSANF
jgi:hypothetical protein